MKFAKQLEDDAVPEWRPKYLDYKGAKKKLKAVARAQRATHLARSYSFKPGGSSPFSSLRDAPVRSLMRRDGRGELQTTTGTTAQRRSKNLLATLNDQAEDGDPQTTPRTQPLPIHERSPLRTSDNGPHLTRYGSIIGSPPDESMHLSRVVTAPSLELPFPALDPTMSRTGQDPSLEPIDDQPVTSTSPETLSRLTPTPDFGTDGQGSTRSHRSGPQGMRRTNSTPGRPLMRRMFSSAAHNVGHADDVALDQYNEFDARNAAFRLYLDSELFKIEDFYRSKEEEAVQSLAVLRQQLHYMRDQRISEMTTDQRRNYSTAEGANFAEAISQEDGTHDPPDVMKKQRRRPFAKKVDFAAGQLENAMGRVRTGHVGKTSKAMDELGSPSFGAHAHDYQRRNKEVTYRNAKSALKRALADYYRHLELIKSYALVNRTAFRKINKKYDKTVNARPKMRYMDEKVNKAHFVTSGRVESIIQQVEDLYARYFERGNHKLAVGKLRQKLARPGQYSGSSFRVGALFAAGSVLTIQAVVYGLEQDFDSPEPMNTQASYLLQIYAGYFLGIVLMTLFVIDCAVFSMFKINYQLIFEFDSRNELNWKELAEFPAACLCLLGVVMLLNFQNVGGSSMYIYWPVVLIALTVIFTFLPAPVLYHRSRQWFADKLFRLSLSGLYPIFFADFFLGDMFCSLTYAMGNIELFFCLYRWHWVDPPRCNSSHSLLLGFFSTLPGIWRLLQCFRRFYDEGWAWFPHLVNGGKYTCTILYYLTLSLYRRNHSWEHKATFIVFATLNALYCTVWDLYFDWSLDVLNFTAKPPMLRPTLIFRQHKWMYYLAIPLDIIVRFNWIFYAIFTEDLQHSTAVSFFVALTEVFRRAVWVIFRVENEQCTNMLRSRAVRNAHLPYKLEQDSETQLDESPPMADGPASPRPGDLESGSTTGAAPPASGSLHQRRPSTAIDSPVARTLRKVGSTMLTAHARDYEKKKDSPAMESRNKDDSDEDDDDDDDGEEDHGSDSDGE